MENPTSFNLTMHNLCSHLPLSALLPNATVKGLSDLAPVLGSVLLHILNEGTVFFFCPGTLDHLRVEDLLPAVEALDLGAGRMAAGAGDGEGDGLPVPGAVLVDGAAEGVVLRVFFSSNIAWGVFKGDASRGCR